MPPIPRWRLIAAFAAVYFIWGSSYLAIRNLIETIPPLFGAGMRFIIAGLLLLGWAALRGDSWPTRANWRVGFFTGAFMFLVANGGVVWATQFVPSSMLALTNATIPLWIVLINWLIYRSVRPGAVIWFGLLLGLAGMILLIGPGAIVPGEHLYPPAVLLMLATPIFWAVGSLMARQQLAAIPPLLTTGMQLFSGGILLLVLTIFSNELLTFSLNQISWRSLAALIYLIFASSIVAYSCYVWLINVDTPARASTYAFVNPVVALVLGVLFADEPFTTRTLIATLVILSGVVIITYHKNLTNRGRMLLATVFH